jgi:hypothetical protein
MTAAALVNCVCDSPLAIESRRAVLTRAAGNGKRQVCIWAPVTLVARMPRLEMNWKPGRNSSCERRPEDEERSASSAGASDAIAKGLSGAASQLRALDGERQDLTCTQHSAHRPQRLDMQGSKCRQGMMLAPAPPVVENATSLIARIHKRVQCRWHFQRR